MWDYILELQFLVYFPYLIEQKEILKLVVADFELQMLLCHFLIFPKLGYNYHVLSVQLHLQVSVEESKIHNLNSLGAFVFLYK